MFIATLIALILGAVVGVIFGVATEPLANISKLVVQALKAVAVPLLFVAIVDALARSHLSGRGFGFMLGVSCFNGLIAIGIGMVVVHVFEPGQYLAFMRESVTSAIGAATGAAGGGAIPAVTMDWQKTLASMVPESLIEPFVSGSTPAVILIAVALGLALRLVRQRGSDQDKATAEHVCRLFELAFRLLITIIGWVVYAVPIAVFCAVAKAVGKSGLEIAGALGIFLCVCIGAMLLQILLTYQGWILVHPRITLRNFWSAARQPTLYAFGINSSLATIPMTLDALEDMGVRQEAARLSACVGTNLNNDGILLYEVMAALILSQAFGHQLTLIDQLYVAAVSIVATIGVAGFPEAGIVALTLVLSTLKLPAESIVMLMSVDWLISRSRSATNVLSDIAVGVAIDGLLARKIKTA